MDNLIDEKNYTYYMISGGLKQIRINLDMDISTRIQKRISKLKHDNMVSERECVNEKWQDLVAEINAKLQKEDKELIHFNVDK
jgi:hypothetical protein